MVSKGVDYYTYMTGPQFSANITAPAINNTYTQSNNFIHQNLQIDSSNIPGPFNYTGTLAWQTNLHGASVGSGNEAINALTGQLEGGTMTVMMHTPSSVGNGYALSYGFYDAGSGSGTPLTNQDQLYVYLTDNYATWMGDLVNAHPAARNAPFQQFALPGAHDAGMFYLGTVNGILSSPYAAALIAALTAIPVIGPIIAGAGAISIAQAPRAITNLAMTQKDNITTMLNLGIRYVDFRPGTLYPAISAYNPGVRYHQHAVIPGYPYISFLQDVLTWLSTHPSEIVVVSANTQGFTSSDMNPSPQDLLNDLAAAFTNTGLTGKIGTGDKTSLPQTYAQLLAANTRLIFLNQISSPPETTKYDSYSDAYATATPGPIIAAFNGMNTQGQVGYDYTVLQMQGTTTAMGASVIIPSIATLSDAYSPLMSTKGSFDIATNPWLFANVAHNLSNSHLVVFLNDFADNCMTSTAIAVTKQRMNLG